MQARAVSPKSCGSTGTSRQKSSGNAGLRAALLKHAPGILYALARPAERRAWPRHSRPLRQKLAVLLGFLTEEVMRNLEQDAGAIAGVMLQTRTAAVLQVDEDRKRIVEHLMTALTLQMWPARRCHMHHDRIQDDTARFAQHFHFLHSEPLTLTIEKPLSACPLRSTTFANRLPFPF